MLNESGTDGTESRRKLTGGRKIVGTIISTVSARSLQLEFPVAVSVYGSETTEWREIERSRIIVLQMDNLRGLFCIRAIDKVSNALVRELCRVTKEDENFLRYFNHAEIMRKRWIEKKKV